MSSSSSSVVIFLHLPKAAGTTLKQLLRRFYPSERTFTVDDAVVEAFGDETWKEVSPEKRWEHARSKFANLPTRRKQNVDVVMGHMFFGWHRLTPRPCKYITVLRDPVARVASHYRYMRSLSDHPVARQIQHHNLSLSGYIDAGLADRFDNIQVRFLSGDSSLSSDSLKTAKQNLVDHFAYVGLLSHFDRDLLEMADRFDWPTPYYVRQNVSRRRKSAPLSARVREKIRKRNALDVDLYRFVEQNLHPRQTTRVSLLSVQFFRAINALRNSRVASLVH
jgi:hypothetical protein